MPKPRHNYGPAGAHKPRSAPGGSTPGCTASGSSERGYRLSAVARHSELRSRPSPFVHGGVGRACAGTVRVVSGVTAGGTRAASPPLSYAPVPARVMGAGGRRGHSTGRPRHLHQRHPQQCHRCAANHTCGIRSSVTAAPQPFAVPPQSQYALQNENFCSVSSMTEGRSVFSRVCDCVQMK